MIVISVMSLAVYLYVEDWRWGHIERTQCGLDVPQGRLAGLHSLGDTLPGRCHTPENDCGLWEEFFHLLHFIPQLGLHYLWEWVRTCVISSGRQALHQLTAMAPALQHAYLQFQGGLLALQHLLDISWSHVEMLNVLLLTPNLILRNDSALHLRNTSEGLTVKGQLTSTTTWRCTSAIFLHNVSNTLAYSGGNNYLIPCWFCRFAHLQTMELCIIVIIGTF